MTFVIRYSKHIDWKQFHKFSARDKKRIKQAIERKLAVDPILFGKPLRRSLFGCRSLRVGSYRIVYRMEGDIVEVLLFGHRSTVYADVEKIL